MAENKAYTAVVNALLTDNRVIESQMFGMPCVKIGGKAFAGLFKNNLVVKIGASRTAELLKSKAGRQFDPSGMKRPMKEWVMIKSASSKEWIELAGEAKKFVAQK
ncbi:MAG TPA: hypothetical protein VFK30_13815 [Anaerolineae bacterium]|nr:hypothetical protein [Anaerolineae bacterium]